MHFLAWGLYVPEWAATGTKKSPVHGSGAEWEGTVDPSRPHLPSFSAVPLSLLSPLSYILPRPSVCVSPLVQRQKASGHCLCCLYQFPATCRRKGDESEGAEPQGHSFHCSRLGAL